MKQGTKVLVTTDKDKRGVFGGILEAYDMEKGTCVLTHARMAVRWSSQTRGVLGLASIGPQEGSLITPSVPRLEVNGVTHISEITDAAWKVWESEPWS